MALVSRMGLYDWWKTSHRTGPHNRRLHSHKEVRELLLGGISYLTHMIIT